MTDIEITDAMLDTAKGRLVRAVVVGTANGQFYYVGDSRMPDIRKFLKAALDDLGPYPTE